MPRHGEAITPHPAAFDPEFDTKTVGRLAAFAATLDANAIPIATIKAVVDLMDIITPCFREEAMLSDLPLSGRAAVRRGLSFLRRVDGDG
jgi:hypothetical protein